MRSLIFLALLVLGNASSDEMYQYQLGGEYSAEWGYVPPGLGGSDGSYGGKAMGSGSFGGMDSLEWFSAPAPFGEFPAGPLGSGFGSYESGEWGMGPMGYGYAMGPGMGPFGSGEWGMGPMAPMGPGGFGGPGMAAPMVVQTPMIMDLPEPDTAKNCGKSVIGEFDQDSGLDYLEEMMQNPPQVMKMGGPAVAMGRRLLTHPEGEDMEAFMKEQKNKAFKSFGSKCAEASVLEKCSYSCERALIAAEKKMYSSEYYAQLMASMQPMVTNIPMCQDSSQPVFCANGDQPEFVDVMPPGPAPQGKGSAPKGPAPKGPAPKGMGPFGSGEWSMGPMAPMGPGGPGKAMGPGKVSPKGKGKGPAPKGKGKGPAPKAAPAPKGKGKGKGPAGKGKGPAGKGKGKAGRR